VYTERLGTLDIYPERLEAIAFNPGRLGALYVYGTRQISALFVLITT
jgi:hypothetical protein